MIIDLDDWEKLPTQKEIYYEDKTETLMFAAGLGSGKSYVLCRKLLKLSAINRNVAGGLLCPSYPDYKRDIEPMLETLLQENLKMTEGVHYKYNRSEKTWRFCWSKAPIYVFTADRPIAGPNLGYGGVNEFSLIPKDRMNEFLRRIRVKETKLKQKILVGTPEDQYGYLEEFIDQYQAMNKENENAFKILHASTTENTFIDDNYTKHLMGTLDKRSLEVFMSGQIVRIAGDYFYYAFSPTENLSEDCIYNKELQVHIGMDFNVGRMTSTFWHDMGHRTECFDELLIEGNSNTQDMCRAIKARFPANMCILYPDASAKARKTSGKSDLQTLQDEGFKNIRFLSVNPSLRDRQLAMNGRFEKKTTMINPKCKTLIKDLKAVRQEADFTKNKKNPELTHASDSMDYFHMTRYHFNIDRAPKTHQF